MRKFLSLLLSVVMLSVCSSLIAPIASGSQPVSAETGDVADAKVTDARFLNMLNHNFVYGSDFDNTDALVNNAVLALLNLRDSENEDFIKDTYVKGFVSDMYGIEIADMSGLNTEFPQLEGYVYIIPRGYTAYTHEIVSVKQNEDGSYTVVSNVTADGHNTDKAELKAVSLFVKNENSAFGYNIIYSNLITNSNDL